MGDQETAPPLPKRPTIIRGSSQTHTQSTDSKSVENPRNTKHSPRIPARPAPPKPGNHPPSINGPSKQSSSHFSSNKSKVDPSSKRKIEITIVDARPMSEAGFRDIKSSAPKQSSATISSSFTEKSETLVKPLEISSTTGKASSVSSCQLEESNPFSSSPNEVEDKNENTLPPRPKRPTIIRPARPDKSEVGTTEKTSPPRKSESDSVNQVPPLKPARLPPAIPPMRANDSFHNQVQEPKALSVVEEPKPDTNAPVAPVRVKRPSIKQPSKRPSEQEDKAKDIKEKGIALPSSCPPKPQRTPSGLPPPLPSRSPISPPVDSIKVPCPSTNDSVMKRPTPKPRPRSMVISNSMMSLSSTDGDKNDPRRSKSPPPLPTKAPRPVSSFKSPTFPLLPPTKATPEEETDNSEKASVPLKPEPTASAVPRKPMNLQPSAPPARPSAPPTTSKSNVDSNLGQGVENAYGILEDHKDAKKLIDANGKIVVYTDKEKANDSPSSLSFSESDSKHKDSKILEDKDDVPLYAKVNKTIKKSVTELKDNNDIDIEKSKSDRFPYKVKLRSTVNPSEEPKEDNADLGTKASEGPCKANEDPVILPKPLLKPKPKVAAKPKALPSPRDEDRNQSDHKPSSCKDKESILNEKDGDNEEHAKVSLSAQSSSSEFTLKKEDTREILPERESQQKNVKKFSKKDSNEEENSDKLLEKPLPPLPSKGPITIIGRPSIRRQEAFSTSIENDETRDSKASAEFNSKSHDKSIDNSGNEMTSFDHVEQVSLQDSCEMGSSKNPTEKDITTVSPGRKPVRIIGFPQRTSFAKKDNENNSENEQEMNGVQEKSKPVRPAARPTPANRTTSPSQLHTSRSGEGLGSVDVGGENSVGKVHLEKDTEKQDEQKAQVHETENNEVLEGLSAPKKPSRPVARPFSSNKFLSVPTASDSQSESGLDLGGAGSGTKIVTQEILTSRPPESRLVKISPNNIEEQDDHQDKAKPTRTGLPPPRPPSAIPRKALESGKSNNPIENDNGSIKDKPARPQPARPSAPKIEKRKSGPPGLPPRPGPGHILYNYIINQPHGIALHDYTASQSDELSFQAGETVILTKEIDDQWFSGRAGDKEGIFPKTFVDLKCTLEFQRVSSSDPVERNVFDAWTDNTEEEKKPDNLTGPRCRARFDFEGCGEGELTFEDGDVIQLLCHVGSEWLKGEINGQEGIFPSAFVEIIEDLKEVDDGKSDILAIFDFEGMEGDLSFQAGDTIKVLSQVSSEWLYGECNGKKGSFPASFISAVPSSLPPFEELSTGIDANDMNLQSLTNVSSGTAELSVSTEKQVPQSVLATCVALHDYESNTLGDLHFKSGDIIEITEFVGEDWLSGRLSGAEGMFPTVFVKIEDGEITEQVEPEKELGKALHSFTGTDESELTFEEGAIIELRDFVDENQEWRNGILDDKTGMFPTAFVQPI